jgi:hypothetical protein
VVLVSVQVAGVVSAPVLVWVSVQVSVRAWGQESVRARPGAGSQSRAHQQPLR